MSTVVAGHYCVFSNLKEWIERMRIERMRIERMRIERMRIERMRIERMRIERMRIERMRIERMRIERMRIRAPVMYLNLVQDKSAICKPARGTHCTLIFTILCSGYLAPPSSLTETLLNTPLLLYW